MNSWVIAIIASIFSSFLTVLGFVMQKKALMSPGKWPRCGDLVLSPLWTCGLLLNAVAPLTGDLVAYGMAPMSLTTPLSGVTVVFNLCLAPLMLGERIQPRVDLLATAFILAGTVMTSYAGVKEDSDVAMDQLWLLASQPVFLVALLLLCVLLACAIALMIIQRAAIAEAAKTRPSNPHLPHVVLPAFAAAGTGALTNILFKAVAEQAFQKEWLEFFLLLLCVVPFAATQVNFINRGLRLYMQTVLFPVYNALLVLLNTVYGSIFYEEYLALVQDGLKAALFCAGVLFVLLGVVCFTMRKPEDELTSSCDDEDDDSSNPSADT